MERIAFLGLGTMGDGMAARLLGGGFALNAWNRSPGRGEPLRRAGATIAGSPREAASNADAIIAMVADDDASRAVWTGAEGALVSARTGTLLIESSTISPAWARELSALAARRQCDLLDAPVLGSRSHAANGELLFLVGGDPGAFERARPVLKPMSRDALYFGPTASGARMKLVNNFMAGAQVAALAEALAFVDAGGLDREKAVSVLANGAPGSPIVKLVSARMMSRDYGVQFRLALMRKDLDYAIAEAARHEVSLRTAVTSREIFDDAIDAGWGASDMAAVLEAVASRGTKKKVGGQGA